MEYIRRAISPECWMSIAEGGKRAAKNLLNCMAWSIELETHPDKLHFCMGASIASARMNCLDSNGFGVFYYYRGRYREGKYQNKDAVFIQTKVGEKIILPLGGAKLGDEKLFRGFSFGTGMITEAPKLHQVVFQEAVDRTLASGRRKILIDLNPEPPKHWIYTKVLNFHEQNQRLNPAYGYNYQHFTIYDNTSLSDEQIAKVISTYDQQSVWFLRDILGQRAVADGNIFKQVAARPTDFQITEIPKDVALCNIGVDFGGNGSKTTFVLTGINSTFTKVYVLAARKLKDEQDVVDLGVVNDSLKSFYNWCKQIFDTMPLQGAACYCDNENQLAIKTMRQYQRRNGAFLDIRPCKKATIIDRIRCKTFLLNNGGYFFVQPHAAQVFNSTIEQQWNPKKADERLDDGTADIDTADGEEYSWSDYMKYLMRGSLYNQET